MFKWNALALVLLTGCPPSYPCYPNAHRPNYTSYQTTVTYRTPGGISVDDAKLQLDPALVDDIAADVLGCLEAAAPLDANESAMAMCGRAPVYEIRSCLVLKVPDNWYTSNCTGSQLFPCNVPNQSCLNKGLTPTNSCPCACRASIQDEAVIVTAPNLELLPGKMVELFTGCSQIWRIQRLAMCGRTR